MVVCFEPQGGLISRANSRHCPDPDLIILPWVKILQLHLSLTFVQRQRTHIIHYKRIFNSQAKKSENGCHIYNRTRVSLGDICNCYDICNCLDSLPCLIGFNSGVWLLHSRITDFHRHPWRHSCVFLTKWLKFCVPGGWSPVLGSEWCIYGRPDIYS